jgi:hypothetical protein
MSEANDKAIASMADAILDVIENASGPIIDLEVAMRALVRAFSVLLAGGTDGLPAHNVDLAATAAGQDIADRTHEIRRLQSEAAQ